MRLNGHACQRFARGVHLDTGNVLSVIDHGCNRLIVRLKVSTDHQRDFRLDGQIAVRGFQFLDDVFAIRMRVNFTTPSSSDVAC